METEFLTFLQKLWVDGLWLDGIWMTLKLTFFASLIGLIFAIPLSVLALSKRWYIRLPIDGFSYFFRGTPLLVQLYLVYYGLGQFNLFAIEWLRPFLREPYWYALFVCTLNTCAYTIEIFKGSLKNTPHGEIEAGIALGMNQFTLFRRIIFPSGFRRALPVYSNEVIFMLHGTAQVSALTLVDILGVADYIRRMEYITFTPLLIAAAIYLFFTFLLVFIFKKCEKRWLSHMLVQQN